MKSLSPLLKILLGIFAVIFVGAIVIVGTRAYNAHKYPFLNHTSEGLSADADSYETGDGVERITCDYLNGFHFHPKEKTHPGTVVVYGGSEGSPDYNRAKEISEEGYEVLALFFFGQENQKAQLGEVPLEQFDEVTEYIEENISDPRPITAIGTSKGAEFVELLAAHDFPVDNIIAIAPAQYSYTGLDFSRGPSMASFTLHGEDIPFASITDASAGASINMMRDMIFGRPISYRRVYSEAAQKAPDEALIDLSNYGGNTLLLAGDQDMMWPSAAACRSLSRQNDNVECQQLSQAGHAFFPEPPPHGWEIMFGGTAEGNAKASVQARSTIFTHLRQWHGAVEEE